MVKKVVKFMETITQIPELLQVFGKREGTAYWGTVEYTVNSGETAFTGVWGYCAVSPTHKWSGTLK